MHNRSFITRVLTLDSSAVPRWYNPPLVPTSLLQSQNLDAIVVSTLIQIRYYTGFKGSNALLLISTKGNILFTDPRYTTQATQESNCPVSIINGPLCPE